MTTRIDVLQHYGIEDGSLLTAVPAKHPFDGRWGVEIGPGSGRKSWFEFAHAAKLEADLRLAGQQAVANNLADAIDQAGRM